MNLSETILIIDDEVQIRRLLEINLSFYVNIHCGTGVAVKEYLADVLPSDYVTFVAENPRSVI